MDDANRMVVAFKMDKTPGDSRRFCIQEVGMANELWVAVNVGSQFHHEYHE